MFSLQELDPLGHLLSPQYLLILSFWPVTLLLQRWSFLSVFSLRQTLTSSQLTSNSL